MSPLCAILLPSRSRFERCVKCVNSFLQTAAGRDDFEIWLRLDWDDPQLDEYTHAFQPPVRHIIGPRNGGYWNMGNFYTELANASNAPWVWMFNDDATIHGPWLTELEKVKSFETVVQAEWHKLGGSGYHQDEGGPFPILPNGFWKIIGLPAVPRVCDTDSIRPLKAMGWTTYYLPGVTYHHQRDDPATLEAHRKV